MELLIIRHGQTIANIDHLYYGATDSPITEKGIKQAKAAGRLIRLMDFRPDEIFLSERTRTHDTLRNMGFSLDRAHIDGRLNEQNMGQFECLKFERIAEKYPTEFRKWKADFNHYRPHQGESRMEMYLRVSSFLDELIDQEKDQGRKILIITHSGVMRSMYAYMNQRNLDVFHGVHFSQGAILRCKYKANRMVINGIYDPSELFELFTK